MTGMALVLGLASCSTKGNGDLIAEIIDGKAELDLSRFAWINQPEEFAIHGDTLEFTTAAKTDLWMHTMNGTDLVNAPMLVTETSVKEFTFQVKTDFSDARDLYEQCGMVVYIDENNWFKSSVEKWDDQTGLLGSVCNQDGHSDWAPSPISSKHKKVWYRLARKGCDFIVESSLDNKTYNILRFFHLNGADEAIKIGFYACSPGENGGFKAVFTDMAFSGEKTAF